MKHALTQIQYRFAVIYETPCKHHHFQMKLKRRNHPDEEKVKKYEKAKEKEKNWM